MNNYILIFILLFYGCSNLSIQDDNIVESNIEIDENDNNEGDKSMVSKTYTSQYFNPNNGLPKGPVSYFKDEFIPLNNNGMWVLLKRDVKVDGFRDNDSFRKNFTFKDLTLL